MKIVLAYSLLIAVFMYTPLSFANSAAIAAFEQQNLQQAKKLFNTSIEQNDKDVIALQYLAKIALDQNELDTAEDFINQAKDLAPDDASIQFDFGRIMGTQAGDASIFSAAGYAKKSLRGFFRAAELEPDNIRYRLGLMGYYLQAPGIVGGDEKLALKQAEAIAQLDAVQGILAKANVYQVTEEDKQLQQLYKEAEQKFPDNALIILQRGYYYQSLKQYQLAAIEFKKAQAIKPEKAEDVIQFSALYQIGRNSVFSGEDITQGITALHDYIDTAPKDDSLPSMSWARFRLASLYATKGDKDIAQKLFKLAKNETKDKALLKLLKKKIRNRG